MSDVCRVWCPWGAAGSWGAELGGSGVPGTGGLLETGRPQLYVQKLWMDEDDLTKTKLTFEDTLQFMIF